MVRTLKDYIIAFNIYVETLQQYSRIELNIDKIAEEFINNSELPVLPDKKQIQCNHIGSDGHPTLKVNFNTGKIYCQICGESVKVL